jgi:glycosyltransferase involved in cell wall biosynthesis
MSAESAVLSSNCEMRQQSVSVPRVSVIIGAYNGEKFLRPAIEGILNQTFRDFELIVVDDDSRDNTARILEEFRDEKMRVVHNDQNLGISATLNKGLALARGEYIALQDHDDISAPERLAVQVAFLDNNAQIGMVGSSCNVIDEAGRTLEHRPVENDESKLRWGLLWCTMLHHTTLMVKRRAIEEVGGYSPDPRYRFAEDYDLMSRVALRYRVANLHQTLGYWRVHKTSASQLNARQQVAAGRSISQRNISTLLGWERVDPVCWKGLEKFLYHPVRQPLHFTSVEVKRTLNFLTRIHNTFCNKYGISSREAAAQRRKVFWQWGKHALALSYRRDGPRDVACRFSLLVGGAKLVASAVRPL